MIRYAITDATGLVIGVGEALTIEEALASGGAFGSVTGLGDGEDVEAGEHYLSGEDFFPLPPKPEEWLVWSGTAWVDPRTETDRFNQLHQARLATSIPTSELFIRLAQYGAFPMAEVANYEFPPTVDEFLALPAFTTAQHDLIKGGLKSWATISRAETRIFGPIHPSDPGDGLPYFIPWLAAEKSITITEAQADEMFGVPVPPPLYTAP